MSTPANLLPLYDSVYRPYSLSQDDESGRTRASKKFKRHTSDKLVTFPEHLKSINWQVTLPKLEVIRPFIISNIKDKSNRINLTKNILSLLVTQLFVILFVTEVVRFCFYISDDELREKNHITNHFRAIIRSLSFVAAFFLNLNNSLTGLWQFFYSRKRENKKIEQVASDYLEFRKDIMDVHKQELSFFKICFFIHELNHADNRAGLRVLVLDNIKPSLIKIFKQMGMDSSLVERYFYDSNGVLHDKTFIVYLLKELLLSIKFNEVMVKFKRAITSNYDDLYHYNNANHNPINFRANFCDLASRNKGLLYIILDHIAHESSIKHSEFSRVYESIDITKIRMSKILKEVLIDYWNDDKIKGLDNPSTLDYDALAKCIIAKIRKDNPVYMIEDYGPVPPPPPPPQLFQSTQLLQSYMPYPLPYDYLQAGVIGNPTQDGHSTIVRFS